MYLILYCCRHPNNAKDQRKLCSKSLTPKTPLPKPGGCMATNPLFLLRREAWPYFKARTLLLFLSFSLVSSFRLYSRLQFTYILDAQCSTLLHLVLAICTYPKSALSLSWKIKEQNLHRTTSLIITQPRNPTWCLEPPQWSTVPSVCWEFSDFSVLRDVGFGSLGWEAWL
jgi:hypothetical protein